MNETLNSITIHLSSIITTSDCVPALIVDIGDQSFRIEKSQSILIPTFNQLKYRIIDKNALVQIDSGSAEIYRKFLNFTKEQILMSSQFSFKYRLRSSNFEALIKLEIELSNSTKKKLIDERDKKKIMTLNETNETEGVRIERIKTKKNKIQLTSEIISVNSKENFKKNANSENNCSKFCRCLKAIICCIFCCVYCCKNRSKKYKN